MRTRLEKCDVALHAGFNAAIERYINQTILRREDVGNARAKVRPQGLWQLKISAQVDEGDLLDAAVNALVANEAIGAVVNASNAAGSTKIAKKTVG